MMDMESARHWARALQEKALKPGGRAVDATMGNGGDIEALCHLAGDTGLVYALDVQRQALENTRARLAQAGLLERARLYCLGHQDMAQVVPPQIDLAVFNLGWLPGSPDKSLTTRTETTLAALEAALSLLRRGGLITLCAYPGHQEGRRELTQVLRWARALPSGQVQAMAQGYVNQPNAPALVALVKLV